MAFCVKCGQKLKETDSFCPNCGNKVKKIVASNESHVTQTNSSIKNERKEAAPVNHQQVIDQARDSFNNAKTQTASQNQNSQATYQTQNNQPIVSINQKLGKSALVSLVSSVIVIVSAFLPCISSVSVSRFSVSMNVSLMDIAKYMDYFDLSNDAASSGVFLSGICLVLLAVGTIVGILMKNEKLELILGVCTGLFGLYEVYLVNELLSMSDSIAKGNGFYLMMLGSLVLLFAVGIDFINSKYQIGD